MECVSGFIGRSKEIYLESDGQHIQVDQAVRQRLQDVEIASVDIDFDEVDFLDGVLTKKIGQVDRLLRIGQGGSGPLVKRRKLRVAHGRLELVADLRGSRGREAIPRAKVEIRSFAAAKGDWVVRGQARERRNIVHAGKRLRRTQPFAFIQVRVEAECDQLLAEELPDRADTSRTADIDNRERNACKLGR